MLNETFSVIFNHRAESKVAQTPCSTALSMIWHFALKLCMQFWEWLGSISRERSIQRSIPLGPLGVDVLTPSTWFSFLAGKEDNSTEGSAEMTTMEPGEDKRPPACVNVDQITPARLCKSTFNTTAPMYGVSLTSGEPVTIVQIFPDLLQQVVYEMCE